ncbi:MAG TPA: EAL domain-containing protein [Candidatus Elarobacter sp.]|nr:EAL domain-containing protein [Candidatus Elarobacter sp.]
MTTATGTDARGCTTATLADDANVAAISLAGFAVESAPFGITLASARPETLGRFLLINPAYARFVGYEADELRALSVQDVLFPEDLPPALETLKRLVDGEVAAIELECRLRHRDGSVVSVRQHRSLVRDAGGAPFAFLVHTQDVTERKREEEAIAAAQRAADAALRESEARYRLLAENAADMIVRTRADRSRAYVSPASRTLLGYEPHEIIDSDFATFLHPEDRERVCGCYERFLGAGGRETHAYRLRRRDGSYVWVEAHWVAALHAGDVPVNPDGAVVSIVRDISERKAAEAQIALMACHDPLTGLPNRTLFHERLGEALRVVGHGASAAVLSVDVDNFKGVNDTLGHAAGDALLRHVAGRLRACVRGSDTVARLGGDEFAVLNVGVRTVQDAAACGRRIVEALGEPFEIDGQRVVATVSIGITMAPFDGTEQDALLNNADIALYRAKSEGRNTFRMFEREMDVRLRAKRALEVELRQALRDRAFVVHYQPIVRVDSHDVVACEALVRWQHPERGLTAPSEFIAVAEETGVIVELGAWVLRTACEEAASWPPHVRLSVNLSPVQFKSGTLVEIVTSALRASGLGANRLDLEITESVLLGENDRTRATLHALRALGVGISLDDFGTGYSSLGYIRSFPFDRLKIDRSFIADLLDSDESNAIVRAVIGLGRMLGMVTVAEGVETAEQLRSLGAEGCVEAQGFLFSKAVPPDELRALLRP